MWSKNRTKSPEIITFTINWFFSKSDNDEQFFN